MKELVLIKLGGGLIAPKDWPEETMDRKLVVRLVSEIKESGVKTVIAVGQGNFAHNVVKRCGISDIESVKKVRESAIKPGRIVTEELVKQGISAVLVEPNKIFAAKNGKVKRDGSQIISDLLSEGKIPVVYGDVIDDEVKGWVIFSGEKNLEIILGKLQKNDWKIQRVIQVSREEGVLDKKGGVVAEISGKNWEEVKKDVSGAVGVDVTGGMLHKVEESLEISRKYRIKTLIISGRKRGRLKQALLGVRVSGTWVE